MRAPCRWMVEIALLVFATAAQPSRAEAPSAAGDGAFEFRPGVIVDENRSTCYLMGVAGGVEALDLLSGRILWMTDLAQKPLLLIDDTLVAQAQPREPDDFLRIVLLDAADGALKERVDAELPEGVRASIDEGPGSAFDAEVSATHDTLTVTWAYSGSQVRGAEDTTLSHSAESGVEGAFRVDIGTGELWKDGTGEVAPAPPPPLPPALSRLDSRGRLPHPLWRTGDVYAAACRVRGDGGELTVLKRWSAATGDSLPDVTLFAADYTIRYRSADGKYLLASRAAASPAYDSYDWIVYSLSTGARVAELRLDVPGAWFFVTGPVLVYETQPRAYIVDGFSERKPRRLCAVDLSTGRERWTRPFRDTTYRGSLPPRTPEPDDPKAPSASRGSP
jgi:hypothetical protein